MVIDTSAIVALPFNEANAAGWAQLRRLLRLCPGQEPPAAILFQGDDFGRSDIAPVPLS